MSSRVSPFLILVMVLVSGACAYQPTPTSDTFGYFALSVQVKRELVKRTGHDLNCPLEEQTFKDLGSRTVGVSGCGNRASYKYVSGPGWVMDSAGSGEVGTPRH